MNGSRSPRFQSLFSAITAVATAAVPAYAPEILGAGLMSCFLLMGWREGLDQPKDRATP